MKNEPRIHRLETQARPVVDKRQQAVYDLLHGIAERNPELHSGTSAMRQANENKAAQILMTEMAQRTAARGKTDMALHGAMEFSDGEDEDWEA